MSEKSSGCKKQNELWQNLLEQLMMSEESSSFKMQKWMLVRFTGTAKDEWSVFKL